MDQLTELLHDAVDDIEPVDRLVELRRRTQTRSRRGWYVGGGALLVAAVAVAGIAVGTRPGVGPDPADGPATTPVRPESPSAIYYVGSTPYGPRLYRSFERVRGGEPDHGSATEIGLLMATPSDPDYRTLWPLDSLAGAFVDYDEDMITVLLRDDSYLERPAGMSAVEAPLALQQVVYTMQAYAQQRLPVQFQIDGQPVDQVFGVPTREPVADAPQLDTLALVSISDPVEGRTVRGTFSADGVASSFEGSVLWTLRDARGNVVREGHAQGSMEDHLTPWETGQIDVADLPPGSYTFEARTDDPSGGTEGNGPFTDTRTVVIE